MATENKEIKMTDDLDPIERRNKFFSKFTSDYLRKLIRPERIFWSLTFFIFDTLRSIFFWVSLFAAGVFTIYFAYVAHPGRLVDPKIQLAIREFIGNVFADLPSKTDRWGQLGDFFGGVLNPIIGLATIFLLVQSVTLQRKELSATRKAMIETKDEMEQQGRQMKLQNFETTLFNRLKIYKSFVYAFHSSSGDSILGLYTYISEAFATLNNTADQLAKNIDNKSSIENETLIRNIRDRGSNLIMGFEMYTFPIINNFLDLAKWIDNINILTDDEKKEYFSIIRAQLTEGELRLIYLFILTSANSTSLANICSKYS